MDRYRREIKKRFQAYNDFKYRTQIRGVGFYIFIDLDEGQSIYVGILLVDPVYII
jgi:hypothetical protein